jgi:hypothetical protein
MAWRVLRSGPMIEEVIGHQDLPSGGRREVTTTRTGVGGEVIENDLSESLRTRYEAEDPYVRSIVEYGELEVGEDDDGNPTRTFAARGLSSDTAEPPATDEEAAERTRRAEQVAQEASENAARAQEEAARHAQRVQELEAELADTTSTHGEVIQERDELRAQVENTLSYEDFDKDALAAQARAQGLVVERSDGKQGDPLKSDYVTALEGARAGS